MAYIGACPEYEAIGNAMARRFKAPYPKEKKVKVSR